MTTSTPASRAADAQRRLHLALRALHGPQAAEVWSGACREAGVLSLGALSLPELVRVADVLVARGGADAVAARSCRVLLILNGPGAPARPSPEPDDSGALTLARLREALRVEDALTQAEWTRRLNALAAERRLART